MYHDGNEKLKESWMNKRAKTGWDISTEVTEYFKDYCDSIGMSYFKAQEAAMFIWAFLPPRVRELAILQVGGKIPQVDSEFWKLYLEGLNLEVPVHEAVQVDRQKKK